MKDMWDGAFHTDGDIEGKHAGMGLGTEFRPYDGFLPNGAGKFSGNVQIYYGRDERFSKMNADPSKCRDFPVKWTEWPENNPIPEDMLVADALV